MRIDGQADRHDEANSRASQILRIAPKMLSQRLNSLKFRLTAVSGSFLAIQPPDAAAYPEKISFSLTAFMKQLFDLFLFVAVLCYKSECRWFDPSCCHWNFSVT